jgi:hypothetical protein
MIGSRPGAIYELLFKIDSGKKIMSANIDVFSPRRPSKLKTELDKRVEALEQDVTDMAVLLHDFLQREEIRYPTGDDSRTLN